MIVMRFGACLFGMCRPRNKEPGFMETGSAISDRQRVVVRRSGRAC